MKTISSPLIERTDDDATTLLPPKDDTVARTSGRRQSVVLSFAREGGGESTLQERYRGISTYFGGSVKQKIQQQKQARKQVISTGDHHSHSKILVT